MEGGWLSVVVVRQDAIVLQAWSVVQSVLKPGEKQCPPKLSRIKSLHISEILLVLVISVDDKRMHDSIQSVLPLLQSPHIIVPFCRCEFFGRNKPQDAPLRQDGTHTPV